jgi:hypothetical protein
MILALFVLLANGPVTVPAAHWKALEVSITDRDTTLQCAFEVLTKPTKVQAVLIKRSQLERFERGRHVDALYVTGFETSARFRYRVSETGDYILLLDNRLEGGRPAEVSLRVELTSARSTVVQEVPLERRRAIVALSLLFFGAVVVFSARQFLKHAA